MVKVRKQVVVGRGLTERRYAVDQLQYPVTAEELDQYEADAADYSADPWWHEAGPIIEDAKRRLQELNDRHQRTSEPHVDEGWYYQRLVRLGDRISAFAAEYEVASGPLSDAMHFGALVAELEIRQLERMQRAEATRAARVTAGERSNRKRPLDDNYTLEIWDRERAATGSVGMADTNTARMLGISPRTVRAVRSGRR